MELSTTPRLACEQCKRRKLRCDKGSPCAACRSSNFVCKTVQRARLPRGKSSKAWSHNERLESRVARIESLLAQNAHVSNVACSDPSTGDHVARTHTTAALKQIFVGVPVRKVNDFVAPDFWAALSEELQGLRETLEDSEDEHEIDDGDQKPRIQQSIGTYGASAILFTQTLFHQRLPSPHFSLHTKLLQLYRSRVDNVYKILHWPTTLSTIETAHTSSSDAESSTSVSVQCLTYAIYFMAICSMTNQEAEIIGVGSRSSILQEYQSAVEALLANSSLLQTPDLFVLQAFVIYLVSHIVRSSEVAVLTTIGRSQNLLEWCVYLDTGRNCC